MAYRAVTCSALIASPMQQAEDAYPTLFVREVALREAETVSRRRGLPSGAG
jgi:hypothetical protein